MRVLWEETAAIREYEAGLSRDEAEAEAIMDVLELRASASPSIHCR
jgi:hypothetical protein